MEGPMFCSPYACDLLSSLGTNLGSQIAWIQICTESNFKAVMEASEAHSASAVTELGTNLDMPVRSCYREAPLTFSAGVCLLCNWEVLLQPVKAYLSCKLATSTPAILTDV